MLQIVRVHAREVLDSRGFPTVEVEVTLSGGAVGRSIVPSGKSKGGGEARELRDGDEARYRGAGVLAAVRNVREVIGPALRGLSAVDQSSIDRRLIELDPDKATLGANAVLGASLAVARAAAAALGLPLYRYLGGAQARTLPVPMMNLLNGGQHADNNVDVQEFMVVPLGAPSFAEALRWGCEIHHALGDVLRGHGLSRSVGDEGGFAPDLDGDEMALELLEQAIEQAGYTDRVALALDVAANDLWRRGRYEIGGRRMGSDHMVEYIQGLVNAFPICSVEDPLFEEDWAAWSELRKRVGDRVEVVGDDLFVTSTSRLARGIAERAATSILVKPNQVGTLSETLDAIDLARGAGLGAIVSHRSGETEDTTIADLAVATGVGRIKAGAPCRSERVAKYNRLLRIEEELGAGARFVGRAPA